MRSQQIHLHRFIVGVLMLAALMFAQGAAAQWWRFGADAAEPVFTDLLFNQQSALRVDRALQLGRDELDNGRVIVRGRTEVAQGSIGRVEASLDDGVSWSEVPFSDRGLFAFEFQPEMERVYRFRIRALSTTGQASDASAHAFEFKATATDGRTLARAALQQLIDRYAARDRSGFMNLVSPDFVGSAGVLDGAVGDDFRLFDSIRIVPTIQRLSRADNRWTVYFSFIREVRSARTGQSFQDRASTSVVMVREGDGYKLLEVAAPLIFGLSDADELATFVEPESAGQSVIQVDADGNVTKRPLGAGAVDWGPTNLRLMMPRGSAAVVDLIFDTTLDLANPAVESGYGRLIERANSAAGPWVVADSRDSLEHNWMMNLPWSAPATYYRARIKKLATGQVSAPSNVLRVD